MHDALIAKIQTFTLAARAILERETGEQLEGIYGWLPDGRFAEATRYPALRDPQAAPAATRGRLEAWAAEEATAGLSAKEARAKLIAEATFTWLNRMVGFKMLESRGLIREIISRLTDSNGFKRWVTQPDNAAAYALYERGDLPLDPLGEGPRQQAYRQFLLSQCATLAADVSLLFDPNGLASCLCPRPRALQELVTLLNQTRNPAKEDDPDFAHIWLPGNEEAVGWMYQAFNVNDKTVVQAKFEKGKKVEAAEIPPVTQLFTPRWVVKLLVENTLGRIWLDMHPDSRLKVQLDYLALPEQPQARPLQAVKDITFLDPCCGSMHFGLVAFDLFAEMYREELERAGEPGWPASASVASADDIPASIVAHNLHGIDIDLRAVQLSALALLLRARTLNPKAAFTDKNLACANVEKLAGGKLEQFIRASHFSHPIYERVLLKMAERLRDSENLGSLLRLEQDLRRLVESERAAAEASKQFELALPGITQETFDTEQGIEEFFAILTEQVIRHLDSFVRQARTSGQDEGHFVGEAAKGVRYLRLVTREYDVVATNPPYLSGRKMNKRMAELMKSEFPEGSGDLYAAFIVRCQELLRDSGLMGMLTMHSFMFISSYEDLRTLLRDHVAIETLAHFGGALFAVGNPGTLQTAAFILRKEPNADARDNHRGTYFRLVKEPDADAKRLAYETAVAAHRADQPHSQCFTYLQKDFDAIPGKPWVYWMPERVRELFSRFDIIENIAPPRQGMATANNYRFLRKWWEINQSQIDFTSSEKEEALLKKKKWFPYMKGGSPLAWYGNQEHTLNYHLDGYELKAHADPLYGNSGWSRIIKSTDMYFRRGVTWSLISSKGFAARISPGGFIFDVAGMTCFPPEELIPNVLAVLNSRIGKFILSAMNPTINFQVGDIERLPIPSERSEQLDKLVQQAIALAKENSAESERTYDFVAPLRKPLVHDARMAELARVEAAIDAEVTRLYGISDDDFEVINRELAITTAAAEGGNDSDSDEADEEGDGEDIGYSPELWARSWFSYAAGIVMGRFRPGETGALGRGDFADEVNRQLQKLRVADGIAVSDAGHPDDLAGRCWQALEVMRGEAGAREIVATACGAGDPEEQLRAWLDGDFWSYHMQLYRNRPVYWSVETDTRKAAGRYRVWIFHEAITPDTLFRVRERYVEPKLRHTEGRIKELEAAILSADNRTAARDFQKKKEDAEYLLDALRTFSTALSDIANGTGETLTGWEQPKGYAPCIDDGVVINAAPLWPLIPKWKQSNKPILKETWHKLATTPDLDWAGQAMRYWPTRVLQTCQTNKSIAIAHEVAGEA